MTEFPARDAIYNWIVRKYESKGKAWHRSDSIVFGGFLYHIWDWVPTLLFVYFTWLIVNYTYNTYGEFKAFVALGVMLIIRLNSIQRQVSLTNRLLKKI